MFSMWSAVYIGTFSEVSSLSFLHELLLKTRMKGIPDYLSEGNCGDLEVPASSEVSVKPGSKQRVRLC